MDYYAPTSIGEALQNDARYLSVCMSVCLSV